MYVNVSGRYRLESYNPDDEGSRVHTGREEGDKKFDITV